MELQSYDINQPREPSTNIHNKKNHHIFKRGWMLLTFVYEKIMNKHETFVGEKINGPCVY
jgi:hypothetical protein